jgi:hypothetical protein
MKKRVIPKEKNPRRTGAGKNKLTILYGIV